MTTPLAKGVIIAASVLVAASIAAYENPQIREWLEQSSQKVAVAFRSFGNDIHGRNSRTRQDSSMHENVDEKAEERRRQARQEIMERGRVLQEKRGRQRPSTDTSRTPSFDSLVDADGRLKDQDRHEETNPWAASTAIEGRQPPNIRSRHQNPEVHRTVRVTSPHAEYLTPARPGTRAWHSIYEDEMRNAWDIDPPAKASVDDSHASESLIDLTPTTEEFPDPDYSIPNLDEARYPMDSTEYFSATASQTSHPLSREGLSGNAGLVSNEPLTPWIPRSPSSQILYHMESPDQASLDGSTAHIGHSEAEMTDDDFSDDFDDGIRTPASAWTEVGSSVSGDD